MFFKRTVAAIVIHFVFVWGVNFRIGNCFMYSLSNFFNNFNGIFG